MLNFPLDGSDKTSTRTHSPGQAASGSAQIRLNGRDCNTMLIPATCFSPSHLKRIPSCPPPPLLPGRKQVLLNGQAEQVLREDSQKRAPRSVTRHAGTVATKAALKRFSLSSRHDVCELKRHLERTKRRPGIKSVWNQTTAEAAGWIREQVFSHTDGNYAATRTINVLESQKQTQMTGWPSSISAQDASSVLLKTGSKTMMVRDCCRNRHSLQNSDGECGRSQSVAPLMFFFIRASGT